MPDINITFGMHDGFPLTYGIYMTDGEYALGWIFDLHTFKEEMQDCVKYGLRTFKEKNRA